MGKQILSLGASSLLLFGSLQSVLTVESQDAAKQVKPPRQLYKRPSQMLRKQAFYLANSFSRMPLLFSLGSCGTYRQRTHTWVIPSILKFSKMLL